jgi:hypothetical protein
MNHRGAHINDVATYAHTFFIFLLNFFIFSLFCAAFFVHLPFIFSFFHKSATKTRYNSRVSKKLSSVCYKFSALTSTNNLTNIATSNTKTHKHESCRSLFSLSFRYMDRLFWIKEVGDNDPEK